MSPPTDQSLKDPGPESLDKVRDILFGGQMRMVESRFQNLEERLLQELKTLRAEFTRQLGDLNGAIKTELETVNERLAVERAKRVEELRTFDADLRDALRSLERRHATLEEAASLADADLRDQILQHSTAITGEIARLADRTAADLDRSMRRLEGEKLDTSRLAGVLAEIASRLADDGRGGFQG